MSGLSYRTRGNSTPQGKERVYFTCHPADFKDFFNSICEDIFKTQNCAIWYREDMEEAGDDLSIDLGQMQLFVIPITSQFLYQPNRAREVEFKFAVEHHIPVLPLMQEPGLESEFNCICGELQCLDKQANAQDLTALPYEKKLKSFLESVLLGDDLAVKVRAAFDAYIFLSYRKKDRKYAQELMRLIHKNSFCRDIAIWYDEFLTPGENFNEAIREAMEKSNLFAMLVTPNLVNEVNYVMTTEYPKAAEAGIPVLPAQMVETDIIALQNFYPGICDKNVIDAHNSKALSDALSVLLQGTMTETQFKSIRRTAMADQDIADDPQHLFFVGLAYLGGIDVEVDTERAAELITSAADMGLEDAIKKLVSMYRNGDGVQRDYEEVTRRQKELVEICCSKYKKDQTERSGGIYYEQLMALSEYAVEKGDLELEKETLWRMLEHTRNLDSQFASENSRQSVAITCDKIGDLFHDEGNMETARAWYEEGCSIIEILARNTNLIRFYRELAVSYRKLGNLCREIEDYDAALRYCKGSLNYCEIIDMKEKTERSQNDIAIACSRLGEVFQDMEQLDQACEFYERYLKIAEAQAAETGWSVSSSREVYVACIKLGEICRARQDWERAEEFYERGMNITKRLAEETGWAIQSCCDLIIVSINMGDICCENKNPNLAWEYYNAGEKIFMTYVARTEKVENRNLLGALYSRMGILCKKERRYKLARDYYTDALKILIELAKKTTWPLISREISNVYIDFGDLDLLENNVEQAIIDYEHAGEMMEELVARSGKEKDIIGTADFYEKMGNAFASSYSDLARKYYIRSRQKLESLSDEKKSDMILYKIALLNGLIGDMYMRESQYGQAKESYRRGINTGEYLVIEHQQDETKFFKILGSCYLGCGDACMYERNREEALDYYEAMQRLYEYWYNKYGTIDSYRALIFTYRKFSGVCLAIQRTDLEKYYAEQSRLICNKMSQDFEELTPEDYCRIADVYYECGILDPEKPDYELIKEAVCIMEQLAKQYPDEKGYVDKAKVMRYKLSFRL